jgi:NTP pyrophosphatase (non-canonical NTP hydrolase)
VKNGNGFDYIAEVLKTESCDLEPLKKRLSNERTIRLLHAAMGMATEAGEMLDALKKHIFYGKPLDEVNLLEEVGDSFWYSAVALDVLGSTFDEAQKINIAKLRKRYGAVFTSERAINRDLPAERRILESGSNK